MNADSDVWLPSGGDPLVSWRDGGARQSVLRFLWVVTQPGSAEYVPPAERTAVFDAEGTLWPERPAIEAHFALTRISQAVTEDPSLRERQPFKAAVEMDLDALTQFSAEQILELVSTSHGCMSVDQFDNEAQSFFETAAHLMLRIPYASAAYRPMQELIELLHQHEFRVFVCSTGTADFARIMAGALHGIARENVIASRIAENCRDVSGRILLWRSPGVLMVNQDEARVVATATHIGRRPLLVAGNAGDRADIALMRYSQDRPGRSHQLLVYHDDGERDVFYGSAARDALVAAARFGFNVVSVKRDWRVVFSEGIDSPRGAGTSMPHRDSDATSGRM